MALSSQNTQASTGGLKLRAIHVCLLRKTPGFDEERRGRKNALTRNRVPTNLVAAH